MGACERRDGLYYFKGTLHISTMKIDKEVSQTMKMFFFMVERQFGKQVKIVRTENGIDFTCLVIYFLKNGITFKHLVRVHYNKMDRWNVSININ